MGVSAPQSNLLDQEGRLFPADIFQIEKGINAFSFGRMEEGMGTYARI